MADTQNEKTTKKKPVKAFGNAGKVATDRGKVPFWVEKRSFESEGTVCLPCGRRVAARPH